MSLFTICEDSRFKSWLAKYFISKWLYFNYAEVMEIKFVVDTIGSRVFSVSVIHVLIYKYYIYVCVCVPVIRASNKKKERKKK